MHTCDISLLSYNVNAIHWPSQSHSITERWFLEGSTTHSAHYAQSPVDYSTYLQVIRRCVSNNTLSHAKRIHSFILHRGFAFATCTFFQNELIKMYDKCGSLIATCEVFDRMTERDVFSWNAIIEAYRRHGNFQEALRLFHHIQSTGIQPNQFTFASIIPVCAEMKALEPGVGIHQSIIERGFCSDVVVASALIHMYAKCGIIHKARELFDKMPQKNVVSWTTMIAGYAQNGVLDQALRLFEEMPQRNVISWNAMISGYTQNGFPDKALEIFKQMQLAGVKPVSTTFVGILSACAKMGYLEQGMNIHQSVVQLGFLKDSVVANALLDMYTKCGSIDKAGGLFDKMAKKNVVSWTAMIAGYAQNGVLDEALSFFEQMPERNVVSWNAMISGYAQNGFFEKALGTFKQMQLVGVKPNFTTFVSILPACAKLGALEQGMDLHQRMSECGNLLNVKVASALLDMYAKCGSIDKARELFDKMPQRNVISWNAMIAGYAQNGFCKDALDLFELMKYSETYPDHVSFACVLLGCSHAGLLDEGCKYFNAMIDSYCIMPRIDHYVCMADLLGRSGHLEETLNFIIKMPIKPVVGVWTCLLGVCRPHKNIRLGVFIATLIFELDPTYVATYVLLSNIYAEVGRWGEAQMLRGLMKDRGIKRYLDVVGLKTAEWYMLFVWETDHIHRQRRSMQNWQNCLGR